MRSLTSENIGHTSYSWSLMAIAIAGCGRQKVIFFNIWEVKNFDLPTKLIERGKREKNSG